MENEKKKLSRREFLKRLGASSASAAALLGMGPLSAFANSCDSKTQPGYLQSNPGSMTYRINRVTNDKVSLLGYGMMRLPQKPGTRQIDQDMVNKQVDYALAHGINYFDTAPIYHGGQSEVATGIALKRHPRESFFIATKLSDMGDHSLEFGKKSLQNSLSKLQVDYLDYYLMHHVGASGMDNLKERYLDNGLLDWLCEQRDKGIIRNLGFSYHGNVQVFDWLVDHNDKYKFSFVQIEMNYIAGVMLRSLPVDGNKMPMQSTSIISWKKQASSASSWNPCWVVVWLKSQRNTASSSVPSVLTLPMPTGPSAGWLHTTMCSLPSLV